MGIRSVRRGILKWGQKPQKGAKKCLKNIIFEKSIGDG